MDSGVTFLRSQNIHFDGLRLDDVAFIDRATHLEMLGTRVRAHDVLLNITGASIGRATHVPAEISEANVNQHVCIIRPAGGVNSRFLAYALSASPVQYQISLMQVGGNREGLNFDQVGHLRVPDLTHEEQARVADYLDCETARIDKLVTLQLSVRNKLDERERALRDGLVHDLAESCGELPLRRFVTKIEQGASPQCEAVPREGADKWAVLKLSAVRQGRFDHRENKRLPQDVVPTRAYEVRPGDLLVTRANTPNLVGDVAVVTDRSQRLLLPDLIYRVGLVPEMDASFVAQVALSSRVRLLIESAARGSSQSMVKIRGEDIREWPIPVSTSSQQRALLVEVERGVERTARLRAAVDRQLSLLAERRQALITAAITGQLDVTTACQSTPA
ncbi:restriction endonuclease subunit S domain-containing protein [Streptomyces luteolus]|uniref:Type I restriction modification DNA specificity domain-containing protein n=1 Tax=Streptomyces luteolus TaxID=3043615 RepID=A0ABT6SQQ3_9ACTN|nr:hypothetical protein [Streptomyces sp. B-S-A12]MDI3417948.1 hypothetical protein [Streptomyces sp. B-S-A12]